MTVTRPELHIAIAGQKSKASDYNDNFDLMMDFVEDSMDESETYVQEQLTTYSDINTLASEGTIALTSNSINSITPTGAVTFTLPTITDNTKFHQILIQANLTNTSYLTASNNRLGTQNYFNGVAPTFPEIGHYNIYYEYDATDGNWYVGNIIKGV